MNDRQASADGLYVLSMAMTVGANVLYHIFQRAISPKVHPLLSLVCTYSTGLAACVLLLPVLYSPFLRNPKEELAKVGWASYALGASIVMLELGFLLVYRAGWDISVGVLYSNVAVAAVLLPFGILVFHERFTWQRGLGLMLAIAGLFLLGGKGPGTEH